MTTSMWSRLTGRTTGFLKTQFSLSNKTGETMRHPGAWMLPGEIPLATFLSDFKPSRNEALHVSSDRTQHRVPFYWVITEAKETEEAELIQDEERLMREGTLIVNRMKESWSKAKDIESKEQLRLSFRKALVDLATSTNIASGKWSFSLPAAQVDATFSILAHALATASGSLVDSPAQNLRVQSAVIGGGGRRDDAYEMMLFCQGAGAGEGMKKVAKELIRAGVSSANYKLDASILLDVDARSGLPEFAYSLTDFVTAAERVDLAREGIDNAALKSTNTII